MPIGEASTAASVARAPARSSRADPRTGSTRRARALRKADLDEGNLLGLDLEAVRRTVEGHAKIRKAYLDKHYPDDLEIQVDLREIVALLLHDPILAVDRGGVIVQTLTTRADLATRYPYVTGLDLVQFEPGAQASSESLTKALDLLSFACGAFIFTKSAPSVLASPAAPASSSGFTSFCILFPRG